MTFRRGLLCVVFCGTAMLASDALVLAQSGREEAFAKGLQRRALYRLLEQYLEEQEASGGDPLLIKEQQAALHDVQAQQSGDERERDKLFGKAKQRYRELIDAVAKRAGDENDTKAKTGLRLRVLNLKLSLAQMIWQREAFNQLNYLEITNKQRGNREKIARLMREATDLFFEIYNESSTWSAELEKSPEFDATAFAETEQLKEYSTYQMAWTSYYLAYALPEGDKDREGLLKDAIAKFTNFAKREDDFQAKWESFKGIGMCYRELGDATQAVENLRKALNEKVLSNPDLVPFCITVHYEIAQTYLAGGKFAEARQAVEELRKWNPEGLKESFHGQHLLPLLDARITLAEGQTDPAKREAGLEMMRQLWLRGGIWTELVASEVGKLIAKKDMADLKPFEIWIVASEAFTGEKYEEAAKYFEQYVKIVPTSDPTHPVAKYNLARCYDKLSEKLDGSAKERLMIMSANGFQEIAEKFPTFESRDQAAQACVKMWEKIHAANSTPENLQRFTDMVAWLAGKGPAVQQNGSAAETQWLLARLLKHQGKFDEAAVAFAKVTTDSENYYEAMFEAPNCFALDILQNKVDRISADQLKRLADEAVTKIESFVSLAAGVNNPPAELRKSLRENAAKLLVTGAELLSQKEIQQFARGLKLIERYQQEYQDQSGLLGAALKVKIYCYQGLGQLDKAYEEIEKLIQSSSPEIVIAVLQDLFVDITEEIRQLVSRGMMDRARERVAMADTIGGRFQDFLIKKKAGLANQPSASKEIATIDGQIETVKGQLAELHMQARDLDGPTGAIARYTGLIGFDPYTHTKYETINLFYLQGLAASTQYYGQQLLEKGQRKEAYDALLRSVKYWDLVSDGYAASPDEDMKRKQWEAHYERCAVRVDLHDLEQEFNKTNPMDYKQEVKGFILLNRSSKSSFGGPDIKVKFDRMADSLGLAR
ncbi:MAG: tetratricopeptide repeat protein [Phycisphaerae bacterium]|nr:tetratricopeptide repeat protein [Phycisphaerae bacterium]